MTTSEIATLPGYEEFAPWLLVEKTGNVHVVSINRPEAFNAVNEEVHHAFATIWRVLAADDDVRAVVTTGVGKAFSAGGDMVMFGRLIDDAVARQFQITEARTVFLEVINFPKPLVSAVNGPAVGLGCSIALLSDFLVMGESSYLADPHVAVGLVAGDGGAAMLPLLIGMMKAKEYVLLGDRITAADRGEAQSCHKSGRRRRRAGRSARDRGATGCAAATGAAGQQGCDEHASVEGGPRSAGIRAGRGVHLVLDPGVQGAGGRVPGALEEVGDSTAARSFSNAARSPAVQGRVAERSSRRTTCTVRTVAHR